MKFWPFLFRELRKHWRFALLFVAILGIGLSGFLLVEALRSSVAASLATQSRAMLGADLAVSVRRPFSAEESEKIRAAAGAIPSARTVEFFTMLGKGTEARLVLVKAVDSAYPLFGELATDPRREKKTGEALDISDRELFVSPEILTQLGASTGETLQLGGVDFRVAAAIADDPTQSFRAFALGGRAYLHEKFLAETNLLKPGATATYSYFFLCENEPAAEALKRKIEAALPSPEVRVTTAKEAGESSTQALSYMGDFLGLVSLIALLLSSLGAAYLYRSHLERRKHEIAIYRALGLPLSTLQLQAAAQTILLALVALGPAVLLALLVLPALESAIGLWSNVTLELRLYPAAFVPLLLLCVLGTPLVLLPELLALKRFSPLDLFREDAGESARRHWLHYVPALLLFAALAPLVARSFRNASVFLGLLAVLILLLLLVLRTFARVVRFRAKRWTTHHAFLFLARKRRSAATVFLTLALGSLLLHLLPQMEASLRAELEEPKRLPSLFLFDIQEEQKAPLEAELARLGHTLTSISPLVRARILTVNGKSFERASGETSSFQTGEDERSARFRNRGVNLSFRGALQESETLIRGRPFSAPVNAGGESVPEISVETRFAERMGLALGDLLRFDVQGVEVSGRIVNERRVRWTSFQPNFFLVFQEGVLDGAPKTYLANLAAIPREEKIRIQALLAKSFPNISVIDVASAIAKILDLLGRMRLALLLLAALALGAGFSVLASVLSLEARERGKSLVLYRTLGASESDLRRILFTESFVLSSLAIACGALGSILFTYGLSRFVFDGAFAVSAAPLVGFSFLLLGVSLLTSWFASRALVRRPPLELLRNADF